MGKDYIEKTLSRYNFIRPSFFEGMARVLDLGGTIHLYKPSVNEPEANAKAMASDWEMLGEDLRTVMGEYGSKSDNGQKPKR